MLADDDNLTRSAPMALLALETDLDVVAQAAFGVEALAMARAHEPDLAIVDMQMSDRDGTSVAAELSREADVLELPTGGARRSRS